MSTDLEASYAYCRKLARERARNFYYAFVLLARQQRDAMCALYAFNRVCDDMSDEPEHFGYASPEKAIEDWRAQLDASLAGEHPDHPLWPAFQDAVRRFRIPPRYFHEMIDGVTGDLTGRRIDTFEELYRYCYQVASTVGLSVLHVFGFSSEQAPALAEKCGIAFQLTNILRDVREDAAMGRVYLPAEDLERFGVEAAVLNNGRPTAGFLELMRFETARARRYYNEAAPLVELVDSGSRRSLWVLIRIYSRLLERIEASGFDVLGQRIRVPTWEKSFLVLRGLLGRARPIRLPVRG